jgi:hypothetical protein
VGLDHGKAGSSIIARPRQHHSDHTTILGRGGAAKQHIDRWAVPVFPGPNGEGHATDGNDQRAVRRSDDDLARPQ